MKPSVAIVACAAGEDRNINEWVSYHIRLGFGHVYLYCNDEHPESLYKTVLPWIDLGFLTFYHHPVPGDQRGMYMAFLHTHRSEFEWITFLDIDEYFSIRECMTINEFLEKRRNHDCIYFNWLRFGTNGYEKDADGLLLENYTHRAEKVDPTFKIIVKSRCIDLGFMLNNHSGFHHGLGQSDWFYSPFNGKSDFDGVNVLGDPARDAWDAQFNYTNEKSEDLIWTATIAHFYLKSEEHYKKRSLRGKKLGPGWELEWTKHYENGDFKEEIRKTNTIHDTWLKMQNHRLVIDVSAKLRVD